MTETYEKKYHGKKKLHGAIKVHDSSTHPEKQVAVDDHVPQRRIYQKRDRSKPVQEIQKENRTCPDCSSIELITDEVTGDLVCTRCGLVIDSRLVFNNEKSISFNHFDNKKLVKIKKTWKSSSPVSKKVASKLKKAKKWTHTWAEIHQIIVKKDISRYIYQLELPSYIEDSASNLYKKVYRKDAIQGRGIKPMVAACIYISCRLHKVPMFFEDIEKISKQEHSTIRKCFSFIMENFQIQLPVIQARQFVPQLIRKLGFSEIVEKVANRVVNLLENGNWDNKLSNPKHLASISIYFAYNILKKAEKLNVSITQKEFSEKVSMSETTLRKYRRIFQQVISVQI